ncbi:unnamed protein product [Darwinula stevensoni]|uniref:Calcyclin-binding protein n=1 Tax=Darwinula stevensoni TaxID=69355 RepID=A0A7R9FRX4_9CRUS|nr:unnamed protein product [Darwinula stevensoni]CAG0902280.1 unnamed protein product [Darwinula stevensoni]
MSSDKLKELSEDIHELQKLLEETKRTRIRNILMIEKRKLETEYSALQESLTSVPACSSAGSASASQRIYTVKLSNYGWDQSDKFVKIYVSLKDVHQVPDENVTCVFTERSMQLDAKEVDQVVVFLAKMSTETWKYITMDEKRTKEPQAPKYEPKEDEDPSSSIMKLMKQMYDDGDDEMKRTIAKAWTEAQQKQRSTDLNF